MVQNKKEMKKSKPSQMLEKSYNSPSKKESMKKGSKTANLSDANDSFSTGKAANKRTETRIKITFILWRTVFRSREVKNNITDRKKIGA
jgi:hypothetical protein